MVSVDFVGRISNIEAILWISTSGIQFGMCEYMQYFPPNYTMFYNFVCFCLIFAIIVHIIKIIIIRSRPQTFALKLFMHYDVFKIWKTTETWWLRNPARIFRCYLDFLLMWFHVCLLWRHVCLLWRLSCLVTPVSSNELQNWSQFGIIEKYVT